MMKVIINADDCGISAHVNAEIRRFIELGLISSTTIMANMDDFDGACQLYKDYHEKISFGIHFNLTEGTPLTYSQQLLDKGFYVERDHTIQFFGKNFDYRLVTKSMKDEIKRELEAQLMKLLDAGFKLTHFDSHQHVHFHRQLIPLFCKVAKKYEIVKFRRYSNLSISPFNKIKTQLWRALVYLHNPQLQTTDYFCGVTSFLKLATGNALQENKTYEVMCHPGHGGKNYEEENKTMEVRIDELIKDKKIELISYD